MQFLIDYKPPWEGAVKDAFQLPTTAPQVLIRRYIERWAERGLSMAPIGPAEAKRKLVQALYHNRAANIRLPQNLISLREPLFEHVLSLPDAPGTPVFTVEDFNALSQAGQTPEALSAFEQTVGRRIRLEDGKELFVDASLANLEWDDLDDE